MTKKLKFIKDYVDSIFVTNNMEEHKMSNINPIKFGVNTNQYYKAEEKTDNSAQKNTQSEQASTKQYKSSEVLNYLSSANIDMVPVKSTKTLDVSKYVTPEQEERIASFLTGFQEDFDNTFDAAKEEFPELSDEATSEVALATVDYFYTEQFS